MQDQPKGLIAVKSRLLIVEKDEAVNVMMVPPSGVIMWDFLRLGLGHFFGPNPDNARSSTTWQQHHVVSQLKTWTVLFGWTSTNPMKKNMCQNSNRRSFLLLRKTKGRPSKLFSNRWVLLVLLSHKKMHTKISLPLALLQESWCWCGNGSVSFFDMHQHTVLWVVDSPTYMTVNQIDLKIDLAAHRQSHWHETLPLTCPFILVKETQTSPASVNGRTQFGAEKNTVFLLPC